MALVAETVASSIIEQLLNKVFEYADMSWWPSTRSLKTEAEKLRAVLPQIRVVLAAVQGDQIKQRNPDFDARLWQFRDAIEAADDVLDEIEYYELEEKIKDRDSKVSSTLSGCKRKLVDFVKNAFVNDGVLNKLREAVKELEAIASNVGTFLQLANRLNQQLVVDNSRETSSFLTESIVVGREKEKDEMVEWLINEPNSEGRGVLSALSVYGMGGMGKTTLVQLVCKDNRVTRNFELIAWICVSDNSVKVHAKTIIKKILEDVTKQSCSLNNLNTLQNRLKGEISSKKFLLILDDVWRDDTLVEWEKVLAPLRFGERGSRILVTTRMESVAKMVAGVMEGENKYLNLAGLQENDFMNLFYKHAFVGTDPNKRQRLHEIGKHIAKKLGACPLAAKVIGGVLSKSLNCEFWNKILNEVILNIEAGNDYIMEILKLSYYHLPTHLQLCFRYCSIFPQDYRFEEAKLVKMWIGSGLIPLYVNEKRPEDVAHEYLDQLTRKSFFNMRATNNDSDGCYFFIHDLLHDLARCVSKGECLNITRNVSVNIPRTIRHLSIEMENTSMLQEIHNLNKLQTLVVTCTSHALNLEQDLNEILSKVKSLRLLSLHLDTEQNIPTMIGDLIHLRYVSISRNGFGNSEEKLWSPKSLYKLYHLQVLNIELKDWDIQESEMEGISNLINLRYYEFCDSALQKIHEIGKLSSLQELTMYHVTNGSSSIIPGLKYLTGLRKLSIFGLSDISDPLDIVEAEINMKKNIKSLKLDWYLDPSKVRYRDEEVADKLKPHVSLNELGISGYAGIRSPCWMNESSYCNLTNVKLSCCYRWEHLPPLGQLNSLKYLEMYSMCSVKQVGYSIYGNGGSCVFPALRRLQFNNMPEWEEWIGVEDNFFPCLEKLAVKKCGKLKRFPSGSGIFPSLKRLEFEKLLELEEWIGLEDELLFPCLDELVIKECPKLNRLPTLSSSLRSLQIDDTALDALPIFYKAPRDSIAIDTSVLILGFSLSTLEVSNCPNIVTLGGSQLLQQPEEFSALKVISIIKCENLSHMPMNLLRELPSLTKLVVLKCPNQTACEMQLPLILRHLKFGSCGDLEPLFIRSMHDLTSLTMLSMHDCVTLQAFPPADVFARMTILRYLSVRNCKELASLNGIEVLTALKQLLIFGCEKLVGISLLQLPLLNQVDLATHNLKIDYLRIDHFSLVLMEPLRSLRFTRSVCITGEVTSLPEQWLLQNRLSLQKFRMYSLTSLQSLPLSIENLCNLQHLEIRVCKMLRSLPNLPPSLSSLSISQCHPELADLCQRQTGLYWSRISHIRSVNISTRESDAPHR